MARRWMLVGAVLLWCGCSTQQPPVSGSPPEATPPEHQIACVPATCAEAARSCGQIEDGCGAMLACGDCSAGETCSATGSCETNGTPSCMPKTCAATGAVCGAMPDGCGGVLQCGTCEAGKSCSGGQCGANACTPKTCAQLSATCGAVSDGCGNVLQCGSCGEGTTCQQNACVQGTPVGSTRWILETDEVSALDSDASGNFWSLESHRVGDTDWQTFFRRRSPQGAVLASSIPLYHPQGAEVTPLGNLFFTFDDCWDAPSGGCTGIQKLSTNGATAWRKEIPRITGFTPAVDSHGSVAVTVAALEDPVQHWTLRKYGWDGALLFEKPLAGKSNGVTADSSDALIVWGQGRGTNVIEGNASTFADSADNFIMKLTSTGDLVWFKRVQIGSGIIGLLETTAAGTIVFQGQVYGSPSFEWNGAHTATSDGLFLFTLEANGQPRWARPFTDYLPESARLASVDAQGRAILVGNDYDSTTAEVVSVNLDGTKRWSRLFVGARINAAEVLPDRTVLVGGYYRGTLDFGLGSRSSPDGTGFILRLNE